MSERLYAPIIIPTLNRYNHFRLCLDSLCMCIGSEKTDVYVGVDYPPDEKYVEGWRKINDYLKEIELENPFHSMHIIRRDRNCGVGVPKSNINLLIQMIEVKYDRYIITEDDNIFSPNFLEYINKGLDKYENDDTISYVVGYCHPYPFQKRYGNFFRHNTDMSVWGYGVWKKKQKYIRNQIRTGVFRRTFSLKNYLKVRKHGFNRLLSYLSLVLKTSSELKNLWITDGVITIYNIVSDKFVIVPNVSKVRNIGWDMSGTSYQKLKNKKIFFQKKHMQIAKRHMTQDIDSQLSFDYEGDGFDYVDLNNHIAAQYSDGRISYIKFIQELVVLISKYVIKRLIALYKTIKNLTLVEVRPHRSL